MRAWRYAPPRDPASVPADRRDGGGRIKAPGGASAVGTEHVAATRPDPRQPERGPPIERGAPLVDTPVAIAVACEPLRRLQEVVPRPVLGRVRHGRTVQQIPIVRDHEWCVASGEGVERCTATEDRKDFRVVAGEIDADAGEIGGEVERSSPVHERGHVDIVELEHIGERVARHRRKQKPAILRRRSRGGVRHYVQSRVSRAIRRQQLVLDLCGSVVGPVEEGDARHRRGAAAPAHEPARETQSRDAAHRSRAPVALNRCSCRRSSFTPTRSPGRRSGIPCTRAAIG